MRYAKEQHITIAACTEYIRSRCHRDEEIRSYHPSAPTATLASHPAEDRIKSGNFGIQHSRNGAAKLPETHRSTQ